MIDSIKLLLVQSGIIETIYTSFLPPSPDTALCLYETPGLAPDPKYQYNTMGLQVRTRAVEYMDARNLAWRVAAILQSASSATRNTTVSGYFLVQSLAQQDPFALGRDDLDRSQFVQNYILEYSRDLPFRS